MKFSAVLLFMVLWFTFAYLPIAHMVWFWAGPDAYADPADADAATATAGFIFQQGALDFAGGTVVHINAGIAGLIGCLLVGKRKGYGTTAMPPHNLPLDHDRRLRCCGWAGSASTSARTSRRMHSQRRSFLNTFIATAAAVVAWTVRRVDLPRHADDARCGFGRGPQVSHRHYPGLRLGSVRWARSSSVCAAGLIVLVRGNQAQSGAGLRRLAGRSLASTA